MTTPAAPKTGRLDPFRSRQVPKVAGRLLAERDRWQRQADLAWTGVLITQFSPFELRLLDDLGFLSEHDNNLVTAARAKQEASHD